MRKSTKTDLTYHDMKPDQLKKLAAAGWSVDEVADFYGLPKTLLNNWITTNKNSIGDAFNTGLDNSIKRVERALFERAIGYTHKEIKVMSVPRGGNQGSRIEKVKVTKHYPPEVQACIFYLTNKRRSEWKHRFELQTYTETDNLPDMSELSFNELRQLAYGTGVPNTTIKEKKKNKKKLIKEVEEAERLSNKNKSVK